MNKYQEYQEYVLSVLSERELLEQLAEEAAELAKAALKCIRAEKLSNNTTPISAGQARTDLQEEFSDVLMVAELLELIDCQNDKKWQRWAERLGIKQHEESIELCKAIEVIKASCLKRSDCEGCPFCGFNDGKRCRLDKWKEINNNEAKAARTA